MEDNMPIVTLENAGKLDKKQKDELIKKFTEVVVDATGKDKKYVYVKLEEVPRENFGMGGKPLG